jgi:Icc-related predicted phosphoesterase
MRQFFQLRNVCFSSLSCCVICNSGKDDVGDWWMMVGSRGKLSLVADIKYYGCIHAHITQKSSIDILCDVLALVPSLEIRTTRIRE